MKSKKHLPKQLLKRNRGFTLVEIIISFSFIGLLFMLISYFSIRMYKPSEDYSLVALESETQNVIEIIKSDIQFVEHLSDYYDDAAKISERTTSSYHYYYLYFDQENHLTEELYAKYYIQIMVSKTNSSKYIRMYYIIRKYMINDNLKEVQIGETINLQMAKKK